LRLWNILRKGKDIELDSTPAEATWYIKVIVTVYKNNLKIRIAQFVGEFKSAKATTYDYDPFFV
jgi:hypothetical protein